MFTEKLKLWPESMREKEGVTAMMAVIQVIESIIAARDPYTAEHQERVAEVACAIAKEMGLTDDRILGLRMAAVIHDLGKISIPLEILSKPGKLTDLEQATIKKHPETGYGMLNSVNFPNQVDTIILQHHERLNGSGYPSGLKCRDIILEAKILGVADVFEAMCSHRPYRPAPGLEQACKELQRHRGILYDSEAVNACLRIYGNGLKDCRKLSRDTIPPPAEWFFMGGNPTWVSNYTNEQWFSC